MPYGPYLYFAAALFFELVSIMSRIDLRACLLNMIGFGLLGIHVVQTLFSGKTSFVSFTWNAGTELIAQLISLIL